MAEVKNGEEPTLPTKRTSDDPLTTTKKPKLQTQKTPEPQEIKQQQEKAQVEEQAISEPQSDVSKGEPKQLEQITQAEGQIPEDEEENDIENDNVIVDRKGKGILIEDDEDEDDVDDDDESDSDSDSDSAIGDGLSDDSDFADDPLAEVDLDNILPSRTRRKSIYPGVYLATDIPEENSDESDDPDA